MGDQKLNIQISADASGAVSGLKVVAKGVDDVAQSMRYRFKESAESAESFTDALKEFKNEATQSSRVANFFAKSISEIVPGADEASEAIRNLAAAGIEGFTLGAAIEVAAVASRALRESLEASENQAKTLKAAYLDTFHSAAAAMQDVQKGLRRPQTKTEDAWDAQVEKAGESIGKLREQVEELENSTAPFRAFFSTVTGGLIDSTADKIQFLREQIYQIRKGVEDAKPIRDQTEQIERLKYVSVTNVEIESMQAQLSDRITQIEAAKNEKLHALQGQAIADIDAFNRKVAAINATAVIETSRVREDARKKENDRLRELAVQNSTDDIKVQTEAEIKAEELRIEARRTKDPELRALLLEQANAEIAFAKQASDRILRDRLRAIEDEFAQTLHKRQEADQEIANNFQSAQAQMNAIDESGGNIRYASEIARIRKSSDERAVAFNMAEENGSKTHAEFLALLKKNDEQTSKELGDAWAKNYGDQFAGKFASAITSMISGAKTFAQVLRDEAMQALQDVIEGLVKMGVRAIATSIIAKAANIGTTQGHIAAAVAGAAESQAAIPIIGPALSLAAAASELTALTALTSPLLASAAGGYDIPAGINPIVQTHQSEMILPADIANPLRESLSGGGGMGGNHFHFHGTFIDKQSVSRMMAHRGFIDGAADAARLGRSI